jgi:vacuolar-type H+-ATPase subunit H
VTELQSNNPGKASTQPTSLVNPSPVTEIEKLKQSESLAIQRVEQAKKNAKMELANTEEKIKHMKVNELSKLKKKLSEFEVQAEQKAKVEAETIKQKGIEDAEGIKNKVRPRISKAVDYIVQRIVGGD